MRKTSLLALCAFGILAAAPAFADGPGPDQNIMIKTDPEIASHCIISNAAGSTVVPNTPRKVNVMKAAGKTTIRCLSNDGMWHGLMVTKAKADGWETFISIPWTVFRGAGDIGDSFESRGGVKSTFADSVRYPDTIVVKLSTEMQEIKEAEYGSEEDAIANQPYPDVEQPAATPAPKATKKVKHKKQVYHVTASKS